MLQQTRLYKKEKVSVREKMQKEVLSVFPIHQLQQPFFTTHRKPFFLQDKVIRGNTDRSTDFLLKCELFRYKNRQQSLSLPPVMIKMKDAENRIFCVLN